MAQGPYSPGPPGSPDSPGQYGAPPQQGGSGHPPQGYPPQGPPPQGYGPPKPGKVQAIAIMQLCGGIYALMQGVGVALGSLFLYIPWIFSLVLGVMAILRAVRLLGEQASGSGNQKTIAVMQIINIINGDVVNLVLGIICLVFQGDPEVQQFLEPSYPAGPSNRPGSPGQPGTPGQPGQGPVITGEQYPTVRR
jgi:hypothetical protein